MRRHQDETYIIYTHTSSMYAVCVCVNSTHTHTQTHPFITPHAKMHRRLERHCECGNMCQHSAAGFHWMLPGISWAKLHCESRISSFSCRFRSLARYQIHRIFLREFTGWLQRMLEEAGHLFLSAVCPLRVVEFMWFCLPWARSPSQHTMCGRGWLQL